jgi:multiple sugar transport system substrate-binding protein
VWADGGHVPAWLPVQQSAKFRELKPQSNYVQAAFDAVYDPPGWYTGAGSDFQIAMGGVITNVLAGRVRPAAAVGDMVSSLKTFSTSPPPVS